MSQKTTYIVPTEPLRLFKGNAFKTKYLKRLKTIY
jgi:hypothetical protein